MCHCIVLKKPISKCELNITSTRAHILSRMIQQHAFKNGCYTHLLHARIRLWVDTRVRYKAGRWYQVRVCGKVQPHLTTHIFACHVCKVMMVSASSPISHSAASVTADCLMIHLVIWILAETKCVTKEVAAVDFFLNWYTTSKFRIRMSCKGIYTQCIILFSISLGCFEGPAHWNVGRFLL